MIKCTCSMQARSGLSWRKKQFKVVISNPSTYDVNCLSRVCPWPVQDFLPKGESNFVASIVVGYSCKLSSTIVKHKNMTTKFVANLMHGEIGQKTSMSPFQIILAISNRYTYGLSYYRV